MMMKKVGMKRFLVYKSHVFPQVRKPIRSVTEYFMYLNPNLEAMKSKKMSQLLDEQQKRKLKTQKDLLNEKINVQLRKYYQKYIQPFEQCPDYYTMLFEYAKMKMNYLRTHKHIDLNIQKQHQQPFYLPKKEINFITKQFKNQNKTQTVFGSLDQHRKKPITGINTFRGNFMDTQQIQKQQNQSQQHQPTVFSTSQEKLLYKIYKHIYPSQKLIVLNKFNQFYKKFIISSQQVSKFLLEGTICHLKPFIFTSPLQIYQAKHHQKTIKQCQNQLLKNVQQRDKFNVQYIKLLMQRKNENEFIQQKYQVRPQKIYKEYRQQYYQINKYNSFYSMLKC